jgi:hypothetical protein
MQPHRSNLSRRDFLTTTAACVAAGMTGAGCMAQHQPPAQAGKQLAMCGLDCAACPAFIAYRTNDQALRAKTAAEWSGNFVKARLQPEDINCVGCLKLEGVQFRHCRECDIRQCGLAREVKNCALCPEYSSCEKIAKFIAGAPPARANLEEVRRAGQR